MPNTASNSFAVIVALALAAGSASAQSVSIDLTGVQLRNATNESRSSAPATLEPACRYDYVIEGNVRGQSGLFATLYPNPTPLAEVFESLVPGSSDGLFGIAENPDKSHPVTILSQVQAGSTDVGIFTVNYGFELTAGIDAANAAFFSLTNVVLTPSFVVGSLVFTEGSATITRAFCVSDLNQDCTSDFADFLLFFNCYDAVDSCADIDGVEGTDFGDFLTFFNAYDAGC